MTLYCIGIMYVLTVPYATTFVVNFIFITVSHIILLYRIQSINSRWKILFQVIDLCAAPGSKTAQLIETLHGDEAIPC